MNTNRSYFTVADENLTMEVTNMCNNSCTHCFVRAKGAPPSELSLETARLILDESYAAGYRNLHLTGGEPLLWDHFFSVISYAFEKGYHSCFVNTSGMQLNKTTCNKLADYADKISLSISLQGPREIHEHVRGQHSYEKSIKGIRLALDAGIETHIFTSVGKNVLPHLSNFADDLYKEFNSIKSITFIQLIRVANDIFDHSQQLLTPEDFVRFVKTVAMLNVYGYTTYILENPLATVVADYIKMPWLHPAPPLHRSGRLVILSDSTLTFSHSSDTIITEYNPGSIAEVLQSKIYKEKTSPDDTTCPQCPHVTKCRNNNMLRPSEWYRDMIPEIPYCKRVLNIAAEL